MKKLLFIFLLCVTFVGYSQQMTIGQLSEFMSDLTTAPNGWYKDYNPPLWREYCKGYSNNYVSLKKEEELIEIHYDKDYKPYLVQITCFSNYTLFTQLLTESNIWLPNSSHDYWETWFKEGKLTLKKQ